MMSPAISNGAGMDVQLPDIRKVGRLALAILFRLPPKARDSFLFRSSKICIPLQKRSFGCWAAPTQ